MDIKLQDGTPPGYEIEVEIQLINNAKHVFKTNDVIGVANLIYDYQNFALKGQKQTKLQYNFSTTENPKDRFWVVIDFKNIVSFLCKEKR